MASPCHVRANTSRRSVPIAATLWGDGFAQDTLYDLWAVSEWDLCHPDEYILLFPRLIPQAGEFPSPLRTHLERCVAVRAWRLWKVEGCAAASPLRAHVTPLENSAGWHRDWFSEDDAITCFLRRSGFLRTAPDRLNAERCLLDFLDRVLSNIQARFRPDWDEASEALLAFGAGIHPAYLWPQSALSHARGIAAGWLGHLDRGRTALMPAVVAEYILDVLSEGVSSDRQLVALAGGVGKLGLLRRAAQRRSAGQHPSVRLAPDATSLASFFSGRPQLASTAGAKA